MHDLRIVEYLHEVKEISVTFTKPLDLEYLDRDGVHHDVLLVHMLLLESFPRQPLALLIIELQILVPQRDQSFFLKRHVKRKDLLRVLILQQYSVKSFLYLQSWQDQETFDVVLRNEEVLDAVLLAVVGNLQNKVTAFGLIGSQDAIEK